MKNHISALLLGLVLMLSSSMLNAAVGRCCIAGTYVGEQADDRMSCQEPKKGKFTMTIKQSECGKTITGVVTSSSGDVSYLAGQVTFSGGNCKLSGMISKTPPPLPGRTTPRLTPPGDITSIYSTIEKDPTTRKWQVTDGIYKSKGGCDGTFSMKQQ